LRRASPSTAAGSGPVADGAARGWWDERAEGMSWGWGFVGLGVVVGGSGVVVGACYVHRIVVICAFRTGETPARPPCDRPVGAPLGAIGRAFGLIAAEAAPTTRTSVLCPWERL